MTITIQGNEGSKNVIEVDAYGPVGTNLFSLRSVLEAVTSAIFAVNSAEVKAAGREAALRAEALQNAPVRA